MKNRLLRAGLAFAAVTLLLGTTAGTCAGPETGVDGEDGPTNIVLVLTDDLSANLVQFMPNVQALAADGTTFSQYTVTDSLCCPSRSSILTGRFPHNGTVKHYGKRPEDYLTTVIEGKASSFITASAAAGEPFLLEVATFAPHGPYTPAPQDEQAFPGLTAPRGPSFDTLPADAPAWLAGRAPLTDGQMTAIDTAYRKRAQSVLSIDRMIGNLRQTLEKAGLAGRTVVVFSSDNGFHLGEHRLTAGKQTAFDHDVHVPLMMAGPGVRRGVSIDAAVQNIDLRPTFEELSGLTPGPAVDGRSLVTLLHDGRAIGWRTTGLIEHHGPGYAADDPDKQTPASGTPPTYAALRGPDFTYVEYDNGAKEYYDRSTDPDELTNTAAELPADRTAQ
ncbi:sulfatase family protein [Actinoplanes awajinensis]|uniref:Sulfatase N-terminal domain-containing protein n=1 Tax=Actinoplanes awajinensis subsp. mycoplanecinus TaxID=135947 RepID=A0A101JF86_9ACTN|nr:sulfatase [Actinoplanes awajinensis]KUL25715.1 hypothetical protein ADL15_40245 [Actinoplanes awajinensis subsp. mycoplanecinus]